MRSRVPKTSMNTRNVPIDYRDHFKAYCARRGYTMESAIIALMKKAFEEDLSLPNARGKHKRGELKRY